MVPGNSVSDHIIFYYDYVARRYIADRDMFPRTGFYTILNIIIYQ